LVARTIDFLPVRGIDDYRGWITFPDHLARRWDSNGLDNGDMFLASVFY